MNKESYKSALNNLKVSKDFNDKTLLLLQEKSAKTQKELLVIKIRNKLNKKYFAGIVIFAMLAVIVLGKSFLNTKSIIDLAQSTGNVKVSYINKVHYNNVQQSDLIILSEYELFNKYKTSIFRGEVQNIKNIKIELGKDNKYYQSIATIKINEVYRGSEQVGNIVKVILPAMGGDTSVVNEMRIGTKGIFMPIKYDGTEYREENGAKLYWKDISNYGFLDGQRYAFLQTEEGIIYDENSYKSLVGVSTLDNVKKYILKMINSIK